MGGDARPGVPGPTRAIGVDSLHGVEQLEMSGQARDYLFGQSAEETERLRLQAEMFAPYTTRFLADAGIAPRMKVLDIGTGAGDVALLATDLVGKEGTVVGLDINPALVETARARVAAACLDNVSFVVGDAASVELERDFDAIVGRCVLFFSSEPVALIRRLLRHLRDGGSLHSKSLRTRRWRRCLCRPQSCSSSSGAGS